MEELVKTFHLDLKLLIAQIVNFTIVLLVLYKFAYKPILQAMNERSDKIEKGLKDAENAKAKLAEMEEKEKEVLSKAKKEAQKIIAAAETAAQKNKEEIAKTAKDQTEKMMADTKKKMEEEKDKMLKEIKKEVGKLVIASTEKILDEKITDEKDKKLIEKFISE